MNSDEVRRIAECSGTSVSTVRRVLGHCAGITEETRQTVIRAKEIHDPSGIGQKHRVYVILPDNPKFFWHRAFDVFNGHPFSPPAKFSFYPSLAQHDVLKSYLEPLVAEKNIVLIYSANLNEEECALVNRIAERSLVIQLCEYNQLSRTVFVGADAYRDGYRMGQLAAEQYTAPHAVVLERKENSNMCERCRGFIDGLGASATVTRLPEPNEQPLYASLLARMLNELTRPFDLVFSPSGRTAELCSALYKLRKQTSALGIGCEFSPQIKQQAGTVPLFALIEQDIMEQTRVALRLSDEYQATGTRPAQTDYLFPSVIWRKENDIFVKR